MENSRKCIKSKDVHVSRSLQPTLCHPTKGGNKDNILEWIGLGFNYWPWVPIKRML
jgi:hypothetical protein